MSNENIQKIWKVRTVKNYPEAHNHLLVGQVLEIHNTYIKMNCRTYHFGKIVNNPKDIKDGSKGIRIIPWDRVELINELPSSFDYEKATVIADKNGNIGLTDETYICLILSSYDSRRH